MIVSNEPGYYKVDDFGIRIENLVLVKRVGAADSASAKDEQKFCGFETISLVPIQKKLIDVNTLSLKARLWVNNYHKKCLEIVGKRLEQLGKTEALEWLKENTSPLPLPQSLSHPETPSKRNKSN